MDDDVTQSERSNNKYYVLTFSNIWIWMDGYGFE